MLRGGALHRFDAYVLLDRLIGMYTFVDLTLYGFADKHETDSSYALYDYKKFHETFHGTSIEAPNNPRSWNHCLIAAWT
jgi:hypothetical protein